MRFPAPLPFLAGLLISLALAPAARAADDCQTQIGTADVLSRLVSPVLDQSGALNVPGRVAVGELGLDAEYGFDLESAMGECPVYRVNVRFTAPVAIIHLAPGVPEASCSAQAGIAQELTRFQSGQEAMDGAARALTQTLATAKSSPVFLWGRGTDVPTLQDWVHDQVALALDRARIAYAEATPRVDSPATLRRLATACDSTILFSKNGDRAYRVHSGQR